MEFNKNVLFENLAASKNNQKTLINKKNRPQKLRTKKASWKVISQIYFNYCCCLANQLMKKSFVILKMRANAKKSVVGLV